MDISGTLQPDSDQLDAVDLVGGPRVFTIADVSKGSAEQPVNVKLAEFPRPWRPGKSMRRVLAGCWGADASQWVGRRVELYCDERVMFGGQAVGGTRIRAMSDIGNGKQVPLIVSRGKSTMYKVQPLKDAPAPQPAPPADLADRIESATDVDELRSLWQAADDQQRDRITERVNELKEEGQS